MAEKKTVHANSPFQRARLCGFEQGRIRRLQGFLKGAHQEPDRISPATEAFARKVGAPDLEERAEALHRQIRTAFGFKRKDLGYSCEGGSAVLRAPGFSTHLWVEQDPDEARCFRIGIEIDSIASREVIMNPAFIEVFRHHCDTVVVDLSATPDIEATIDAIEDSAALAPMLDYAADASWLTLKVEGSAVEMRLVPHQVRFSMPRGGDLAALLDGTSRLIDDLCRNGAGSFLE